MKIIVQNETGLVLYAGETLTLTEFGATNGDWFDSQSTTENSVLLEVDSLPADWLGCSYTYLNDEWVRTVDGDAIAAARLAAGQEAAWEAIKVHRDKLSDTGGYRVTVGNVSKWFHSDIKSQNQQMGLLILGSNVPPVQWKTMDGTFVTMNQAWATAIFAAAATQGIAIFAAAEVHKAAMMAVDDPTTYDWRAGWPATYSESV